MEIQFDQGGRISGAAVRTYLLERSRVCQVSDPERNYHCFYMLCDAPPEVITLLHLYNNLLTEILRAGVYSIVNIDTLMGLSFFFLS